MRRDARVLPTRPCREAGKLAERRPTIPVPDGAIGNGCPSA